MIYCLHRDTIGYDIPTTLYSYNNCIIICEAKGSGSDNPQQNVDF